MQAQIDVIGDGGLAAARALHDRIKVIGPDMQGALDAKSLWFDVDFDPSRALKALLPHAEIDLSAAVFDRWLRETKPEIFDLI